MGRSGIANWLSSVLTDSAREQGVKTNSASAQAPSFRGSRLQYRLLEPRLLVRFSSAALWAAVRQHRASVVGRLSMVLGGPYATNAQPRAILSDR